MLYKESLIDLIGETPLVKLGAITAEVPALVLGKAEYLNPGGSVKDRIALSMVEAAEAAGRLRPGGTIVEPTSGNTGIGLAMVAARRGYRCLFTCPDKVSAEKIALLRAYGAEVVVCPAAASADHSDFYRNKARILAASTPGACLLDQYSNAANPWSHYRTTGPEIWRQTDGMITHFVAGLGTGGTVTGAGRYLKEVSDGRVVVVGVDPDGSRYTGQTLRPYLLEGVGQPFPPPVYDAAIPDQLITVTDLDAFAMARRLAREEAMLVGGSGGMVVAGALHLAAGLKEDAVVVVVIPDSGRGYVSKIFNDEWMAEHGFPVRSSGSFEEAAADEPTMVTALERSPRDLVRLHPEDTMGTALRTLRKHKLPGIPVVAASPPIRLAEVLGMIREEDITEALSRGQATLDDPVRGRMSPPPPFAGTEQPLSAGLSALRGNGIILVLEGGLVRGMVTGDEILDHLAGDVS
jgi:cystathionine beta-synthase